MASSIEDTSFLREIPQGIIEEYRDQTFNEAFIKKHPSIFLDTTWINVAEFKKWMLNHSGKHDWGNIHVKQEKDASDASLLTATRSIKQERQPGNRSQPRRNPEHRAHVKTRTYVNSDGRDTIELLSDSDSEPPPTRQNTRHTVHAALVKAETLSDDESDLLPPVSSLLDRDRDWETASSSTAFDLDEDVQEADLFEAFNTSRELSEAEPDADDFEADSDPVLSETNWLDPVIRSTVSCGPQRINRQVKVEKVEYLTEIPSYWPVPREPTAYVVDLRHEKFNIDGPNGSLLTVDALIKNKDQDSWRGTTGTGDSKVKVKILAAYSSDGEAVSCRRTRLKCNGCWACAHVDPSLFNIKRYELDPADLQRVVQAQVHSRVGEEDSPEKLVLTFWSIIQSTFSCPAQDSEGAPCPGKPMLRQRKKESEWFKACLYFVACSGWPKNPTVKHWSSNIPERVDPLLLRELFDNGKLQGHDEVTPTCSRITPARVGGKALTCHYPHLGNTTPVAMIRKECQASRHIYVPEDSTLRIAVVVPDHRYPHSHPMLPATKVAHDVRNLYLQCIEQTGIVATTVKTVEKAPSTRLLMKGKSPSLYDAALANYRVKQNMLNEVKKKRFPSGTGIGGVVEEFTKEAGLRLDERYIHNIVTTSGGGFLIFTFFVDLLRLVHSTKQIEIDTQFKRNVSELNEIEIVLWNASTSEAVTVGRVYSNKADREQYRCMFDELRRLIETTTGKALVPKKLAPGGSLLCFNFDMELAQVLGCGDSFASTNVPDFSGIPAETPPDELVRHFVRLCVVHVKRGIKDLQSSVSDEEYQRLMTLPHLESLERYQAFRDWITTVKVKKIQDWWAHKCDHKWILPCIVPCLSKMDPNDWRITHSSTNMGESQHAWTNGHTGTKLSLLEAILAARELDHTTAKRLALEVESGTLRNNRNGSYHKMYRNISRSNAAHAKATASRTRQSEIADINAQMKELKSRKAALGSNSSSSTRKGTGVKYHAESSSSGRAPPASQTAKAARKLSSPYPPALAPTATLGTMLDVPFEHEETVRAPSPHNSTYEDDGMIQDFNNDNSFELEVFNTSPQAADGILPSNFSTSPLPPLPASAVWNPIGKGHEEPFESATVIATGSQALLPVFDWGQALPCTLPITNSATTYEDPLRADEITPQGGYEGFRIDPASLAILDGFMESSAPQAVVYDQLNAHGMHTELDEQI